MLDPRYLGALRKIHDRLRDSNVNWVITAGVNLALQGLPVEVHDIDLLTDEAGAYEIERRFAEFVTRRVRFSADEGVRSHFGTLSIDGIEVEIMGDVQIRREDGKWEDAPDPDSCKRLVEVEGMGIPVRSLEYECEAYRKLGRVGKAEMVRKWLYGEDESRKA
jgi:hypothetical protein